MNSGNYQLSAKDLNKYSDKQLAKRLAKYEAKYNKYHDQLFLCISQILKTHYRTAMAQNHGICVSNPADPKTDQFNNKLYVRLGAYYKKYNYYLNLYQNLYEKI